MNNADLYRGRVRVRAAALDSVTSWEAAKRSGRGLDLVQLAVVALVAEAGDHGLTRDELFDKYEAHSARFPKAAPRRTPQAIRTAASRALQLGLIQDSGRRRDSRYGNPATVLWIPPKKVTQLELDFELGQ